MKLISINIPERYSGLIAEHKIDTTALVIDIIEMKIYHMIKQPQFRNAKIQRTVKMSGDSVELTDEQVTFFQADMANIQEWVDNAVDATLRRFAQSLEQN